MTKAITDIRLPDNAVASVELKYMEPNWYVVSGIHTLFYSTDHDKAVAFSREFPIVLQNYNHFLLEKTSLTPVTPISFIQLCEQNPQFKSTWAKSLQGI